MRTLNTVDGRFPSFRFCLLIFRFFQNKLFIHGYVIICDILILKLTGFQSILFCYDPTRDQFHTL